jgi:hypothetical protein
MFADLSQMLVHGIDVDSWQHQAAAHAPGRADGSEQVSPNEASITQGAWARAAPGPDPG